MEIPSMRKFFNEPYWQFVNRICDYKRAGTITDTWQDVADFINEILGTAFSESYFRKRYFDESDEENLKAHSSFYNLIITEQPEQQTTSSDEQAEDVLTKIALEKMKLTDLRTQTNANLRRISREQTIIEIAKDAAEKMKSAFPLHFIGKADYVYQSEKTAILELSDWHYGIEINNYWNEYNPEIAKERIATLLEKVISIVKSEGIAELHIVNLGDLICGRIHMSLRLQSRIDVITQTLETSEILAEFIDKLSKHCKIHYYDCLDNHSRLEPKKTDSLELETLSRITPWFLTERLRDHVNVGRVVLHDNMYGEDIIAFDCNDFRVACVHGHNDAPNRVVDNLIAMTKEPFDLICVAHYHHFSCNEKNEVVVVGNGSLMGADEYAKNLRLTAKPSQNMIIVSKSNVIEQIRRILV